MSLPILYSFRRCPYAMRARMALMHCGAQCIIREVSLRDKPADLLDVSSKATVPVLLVPTANHNVVQQSEPKEHIQRGYRVIDESIEIMYWAMMENTTRNVDSAKNWLLTETLSADEITKLTEQNDVEFKVLLDKYKYSDRYPEHPQAFYLAQAMPFLEQLERLLSLASYLSGSDFRFIDAAILPFIRQFAMVDPTTFSSLSLPKLQQWLDNCIKDALFLSVMDKYPIWTGQPDEGPVLFGKG